MSYMRDVDGVRLDTISVATDGDVTAEATARAAGDATNASAITAEAALARNADNLTSGTVADARLPAGIARDSEVTAAIAAQHTADQAEFGTKVYEMAGVELAYAENNTAAQTTVPVFSTYTGIPGATIVVPPTTGPVVVEYGAEMRVGTSGGGVGFLVLFSYTIDGTGTQIHQSALGYVAAQITAWSGTNEVKGRMRLAGSTSERILGLRTTLIRDSGGVTLFIGNGILGGSPTYLAAMGA